MLTVSANVCTRVSHFKTPMPNDNLTPEQRAKLDSIRRKIEALESEVKHIQVELYRARWWQRGDEPPSYDPSFDEPPSF